MAFRLTIPSELPEGFAYQPDFLTANEEAGLLQSIRALDFRSFEFQGYVAKRRVVEYGYEYDFTSRRTAEAPPIPKFLAGLSQRVAAWAGVAADAIREAVIIEYPPSAPMGWHRDIPQFEEIFGVSLAAPCRMRLKPHGEKGRIVSLILEPRSIYCMRGPSRWASLRGRSCSR